MGTAYDVGNHVAGLEQTPKKKWGGIKPFNGEWDWATRTLQNMGSNPSGPED